MFADAQAYVRMETQIDFQAKHARGTGSRSFSIESLLSNNYKNTVSSSPAEPIHLKYEIDGLSKEATWRECFHQQDYLEMEKEFSQKHLDLVRQIKNIDYLPWISSSNILSQREVYDKTLNNRLTNLLENENASFAPYSSLPLPFMYSSWLPIASSMKGNEKEETDFTFGAPATENSDTDDSKSDCSKISDTPKDFSCPKQGVHGK